MKWNCYDLFDYYDAKAQGMPKLQTEAVDMDAVKKRIYARVDIEPQTQRSHGRLWKRVAAGVAAVTALSIGCNLLSVAAGYDGIHAFFESLFIEQTPVSPEAMESLVSTPQVSSDSTSGGRAVYAARYVRRSKSGDAELSGYRAGRRGTDCG